MTARASWSGYLKVSLLSVPVKGYSASTRAAGRIALRHLHAGCWRRSQRQLVCPEHGPISMDAIASGYEAADGEYVILSAEELASIEDQDNRTVDVAAFVPAKRVDPLYFTENTWYLAPSGPDGRRFYSLLQHTMLAEGQSAVGTVVIKRHSCPILLRPIGRLIALTVLRYDAHVARPEAFDQLVAEADMTPDENQLVRRLMQSLSKPDFEMADLPDRYSERLSRLIESKQGERILAPAAAAERVVADDHLIDLLTRTLNHIECGNADRREDDSNDESCAIAESEMRALKRSG